MKFGFGASFINDPPSPQPLRVVGDQFPIEVIIASRDAGSLALLRYEYRCSSMHPAKVAASSSNDVIESNSFISTFSSIPLPGLKSARAVGGNGGDTAAQAFRRRTATNPDDILKKGARTDLPPFCLFVKVLAAACWGDGAKRRLAASVPG
jgi:hypothetical protein